MKKKSRQIFACALALSMFFQQSAVTTLAENVEVESEAMYTSDEAETPIVTENETPTESASPIVEEPATEESATEEPAQEEQQVEQPTVEESTTEDQAAEESTPEDSAQPEISGESKVGAKLDITETSEAGKTDFHYEDSRIIIDATAAPEAGFPEDTQIRADYLDPAGETYKQAVATIENQLGTQLTDAQEGATLDYALYDVYFVSESAGGRLEPEEGSVNVSMLFPTPIELEPEDSQTNETNYELIKNEVVHIKQDGEAEIINNASIQIADDQITSAQFVQDSFSIMGLAWAKTSARAEGDVAYVNTIKMSDKDNGIVDGTVPFDGDDNRGNDSSANNLRIRTNDTITYSVDVTVQSHDPAKHYESGRVGYKFIIPDDPELKLDKKAMGWAEDWNETVEGGNRIYTMFRQLPVTNGTAVPGGCTVMFVLDVGNKKEGDTITPTIKAWCEGNIEEKEVTPQTVTVTSVPKFNISLKANDPSAINKYDLSKNEYGYSTDKGIVNGFQVNYGFTVSVRNNDLNKGIKGLELPDTSKPITFDVNLSSSARPDGEGQTETDITDDFTPILYNVRGNGFASMDKTKISNDIIWEFPLTWKRNDTDSDKTCYQSGTCTITQESRVLHVSITGFDIDKEKFPKSGFNGRESYVMEDGKFQNGCFTSFGFSLIQPTKLNDGSTIQNKYNISDGTVTITASDVNMNVTSVKGDNVADQTVTIDDSVSKSRPLRTGGKYNQEIFYSLPGKITDGTLGNNKQDGSDSAVLGSTLAFSCAFSDSEVGSVDLSPHIIAYNQFVKIDDKAIEIASDTILSEDRGDWKYTAQFVGKAGGWTDDSDMKNAKEGDAGLHYYDSYKALAASGEPCVGMLFKFRGCSELTTHQMVQVNIKVKNDINLKNRVCMLTENTKAWLAQDIQESAVRTALNIPDGQELTYQDYANYAQNYFDDSQAGEPSVKIYPDYVKAVYDENGYKGGETTGWDKGDSLYIVPYKASVSKVVAQDGSDGHKKTYDIDNNQRYVDFSIASKMEFDQETSVEIPDDWTTTVTLKDTLPKGLKYVPGSGYLGGNYTEQTPKPGVITDGTSLEPVEIIENSDGTTTLIWKLDGVKVQNGALPLIHYSCEIGDKVDPAKDVKNEQELNTSVDISTTEDQRVKDVNAGNLSTTGIRTVKLKSFNISKSGDDSLEVRDDGEFELVVNNSAENPKENLYAVDTMPQNGINGTVIHKDSTYTLESLTLDINAIGDASDVEFYFTHDQKYRGKNANEITLAEVRSWTKASLDISTGAVTGDSLLNSWPTAIAYVDASLAGMKSAHITMQYKANKGHKDDKLVNYFSVPDLTTSATADVYDRCLDGIAWIDADKSGGYEEGETLLKNIPVKLYPLDENGNRITDPDKVRTTTTDENGYYKFDELPPGRFEVEFETSKDVPFDHLDVTEKEKEGIDNSVNSKAEGDKTASNDLSKATIKNITMPTIDEMKANKIKHYELNYQNVGFTTPEPVKAETTPGADENVKVGEEITYTITGENYYTDPADVVITDKLDKGVEFVSADNSGNYDEQKHTVIWKLNVPAGEKVTVTLTVKVTDKAAVAAKVENQASVKVGNDAEVKTNVITNPLTYERSLEGTAWFDENQDGRRDDGEELLENVPVTLYKVNEDGTRTAVGTKTTDKNGHYKFTDLEPGNYEVEFTTSEEVPFDDFKVTKKEAAEDGVNSKIDPDKDENGKLSKGIITGITLPTNEEMKEQGISIFNKPNQDGGFIKYEPVKEETDPGENEAVKVGDIITYTVTGENYNAQKTDVVITDTLDKGVDFVSAGEGETAGVYNKDSHTVTWTLKDVKAFTKVTVTLKVKVNSNAETAKKVINQAGVKVGNDAEVKTNIIENPVTPEIISISGTKTWDDSNNQDGKRPKSITVNLLADGTKITSQEVKADADGNWSYSFKNLPKYKDGKEIQYTVQEEAVEGYTTTYDHYNIINTHTPAEEPQKATIAVTKELKLKGESITASEATFYVGLYEDEKCTAPVSDIKAITFKNASASTVEFTGLKPGKAYYVRETDKDGNILETSLTADGTVYTPAYPNGNTVTVKTAGGKETLIFENQFADLPDGFYKEAKLNITKKLLDADGKAKNSSKTFYAGIFDDEACTKLSEKTEVNIVPLNLAGGSEVTVSVRAMLGKGSSYTLYIAETDENGKPVDKEERFAYDVTVENEKITLNENSMKAECVITNQEQEVTVTPTVTPESTSNSNGGSGNSYSSGTGVKTGDDTPIALYTFLLLVASVTITETTLINMIRQYANLGVSSGVDVVCDAPCRILEGADWQLILQNISGYILFTDEENAFIRTEQFASAVKNSDNYFVIITRESLYNLPYSVEEIYGIHSSGKYQNTKQVYQQLYKIYSEVEHFPIEPKHIVVEDSNSGYEFFKDVTQESDIECESAGGKTKLYSLLRKPA